jgi:hypothetical protein
MNFFDRLTDYDLIAYLPQGFLVLVALDYIAGTNFVLTADWNTTRGILIAIVAYIAGHIAATPSSALLERHLVTKWLMPPSITLLSDKKPHSFKASLFPDYYTPLADVMRSTVLAKLGLTSISGANGEDIFWRAYPVATKDENARKRMATFLNLYGFCRNVSFISAATSVALLIQILWVKFVYGYDVDFERVEVALILIVVSFAMFQRYLKFYRLYSVEVFKAYAQ